MAPERRPRLLRLRKSSSRLESPSPLLFADGERGSLMNTSRLEAFSDGVFAVAITPLVLQFTVPEVGAGKLLASVLGQWPQLVTYIATFLTVGVVWVNHHTIFRNLRAVDRTIQFINLVLLLTVVLVPYPTALLGRYLNSGVDGSVAAAFYAVV